MFSDFFLLIETQTAMELREPTTCGKCCRPGVQILTRALELKCIPKFQPAAPVSSLACRGQRNISAKAYECLKSLFVCPPLPLNSKITLFFSLVCFLFQIQIRFSLQL